MCSIISSNKYRFYKKSAKNMSEKIKRLNEVIWELLKILDYSNLSKREADAIAITIGIITKLKKEIR